MLVFPSIEHKKCSIARFFAHFFLERKLIKDKMFSNIYRTMKFECESCRKVFYKKYNYNRHLNRKKPCKPKNDSSKIFQNIPKYSKIFQNMEDSIDQKKEVKQIIEEKMQNENQKERERIEKIIMKELEIEKGVRFECEYCNRSYKQKYNLNKHLKRCKVKIKRETIKLEEEREERLLANLSEMIKGHSNDRREGVSTGTTNITNISGDQTNNIINITLNDYGNEDMIKLDPKRTYKKILNKILNSGIYGIQKYIQYKYCNPEHPQNLTIKYTNKKSNNLMIRKDDSWIPRDKHEVINELYDRDNNVEEVLKAYEKVNDIDKFEEDLDIIQERFLKNIDPFYSRHIEEGDAEKMKEVKKETLNDFYNCYKKHTICYDNNENPLKTPKITIEQ